MLSNMSHKIIRWNLIISLIFKLEEWTNQCFPRSKWRNLNKNNNNKNNNKIKKLSQVIISLILTMSRVRSWVNRWYLKSRLTILNLSNKYSLKLNFMRSSNLHHLQTSTILMISLRRWIIQCYQINLSRMRMYRNNQLLNKNRKIKRNRSSRRNRSKKINLMISAILKQTRWTVHWCLTMLILATDNLF